jgi:Fe-S-cluster-containing hydrogenase component 2
MKKVVVHKHMCPQNHPCPSVNICPTGAIVQRSAYEAPEINDKKCTGCGLCLRSCLAFRCENC